MNPALIKFVLEQGDFAKLQTGALLVFVLLMTMISIWICWPGSKAYYEKIAKDLVEGDR